VVAVRRFLPRGEAGFTLVELMFAVTAIAGVVLAARAVF
jgi:prepilin-type N-terminal cleavage/methylation domain-containing protein